MLAVGAVVLTLWVWASDTPFVWTSAGSWLLAVNRVAVTVANPLLYRGLARGPISIVAPIVASHPALVVALSVVMGSRPDAVHTKDQWGAMVVTLAGAIVIAGCARRLEGSGLAARCDLRLTVTIAGCSSLAYAVLISRGQAAVPIYGELQTLWVGRVISFAAIVLPFAVRAHRPRLVARWWPLLAAQGLLDTGGFLFLFHGSHGAHPEIAAVAASTFGAVTTLLARVVLREAIRAPQWCGVVLVFACVALSSAHG